jgi:hypothetical protein
MREAEVWLGAFLISALDGGEWLTSDPGRCTPGEKDPGAHLVGGRVGPRAGLDAIAKRECPCPYQEPRSSIPQPTHYKDFSYGSDC